MLTLFVMPLLAITPLATLVIFPVLWRTLGSALGWYLRKKTDGRRCHVLDLVEKDEEQYRKQGGGQKSSSDEDGGWETVDSYALGTSCNGGKGEKDWDGIVGFFHPFW